MELLGHGGGLVPMGRRRTGLHVEEPGRLSELTDGDSVNNTQHTTNEVIEMAVTINVLNAGNMTLGSSTPIWKFIDNSKIPRI